MRQAFALAVAAVIGLTMVSVGPVRAATLCQSTKIHPGAFSVTLNSGDTSIVKVTGYKADKAGPPAPKPGLTIHVTAGDQYTLTRAATNKEDTIVKVPSTFTGNVVIDPTPAPTAPSSSSGPGSSSGPAAQDTSPAPRPGGPDDKLSATMKDERYASFSASPAPSPSPGADAGAAQPVVDYTIKGQYPGDTSLIVAQGTECIAIGVHVRPAVSDRFLASAGIGMSNVPKYTIATVQAPASFSSPGTGTPVTRVLKTEDSGHGFSIPLLFNYRLTDNAHSNLYGTVGFFTNPGSGGLVYGLSVDREQFLLTVGVHSNTVNDLAPGLRNNDIVPANINTSITRRVTSAFVALSISTKFVSQLLSPITGSSTGNSSGSSATGTGTGNSGTAH